MTTGLFFGSFNPIHIGHLAIANYMLEFTGMKEIWFVVSPQNPLKKKESLLEDFHRLEMVNLAVSESTKYKSSNIEFRMPKPSYTIHTLSYLEEKYPAKKFALIVGADNLATLNKWKNFELLLEKYEFYVYPRPGSDGGEFKNHTNVKIVPAPLMEISSDFIRKSIKEGKDLRFFLPEKVYDYITEMHFYKK